MDRLSQLPSETLWHVLSFVPVQDLAQLRFVSRKMCTFADHPMFWRHLDLVPPFSVPDRSLRPLWSLPDLEFLLRPHAKLIQSIKIRGVRDSIVRYILSHCHELEELTLDGWTTLSDHAFKQLHPQLKLQRLHLCGERDQPNYTAMDAATLARLLLLCPLQELSIGCQIHIHADTFLMALQGKKAPIASHAPLSPSGVSRKALMTAPATCTPSGMVRTPHLQRLTLPTRRTWSADHIQHLFNVCPSLHLVSLLSAATTGHTHAPHSLSTTVHRSHLQVTL